MTKSERARRFTALREMGCICCHLADALYPCGPVEIHHIVTNGYRRLSGGDEATIPLGAWHHRGQPLWGSTVTEMREQFGPSLALSKRAFVSTFGTELSLLAKVNEMLGESPTRDSG